MLVRLLEPRNLWGETLLPVGSLVALNDQDAAELIEAGIAVPVRGGVDQLARETR